MAIIGQSGMKQPNQTFANIKYRKFNTDYERCVCVCVCVCGTINHKANLQSEDPALEAT